MGKYLHKLEREDLNTVLRFARTYAPHKFPGSKKLVKEEDKVNAILSLMIDDPRFVFTFTERGNSSDGNQVLQFHLRPLGTLLEAAEQSYNYTSDCDTT